MNYPILRGKLCRISVVDALTQCLKIVGDEWTFVVRSIDSAYTKKGISEILSFHGVHHNIVHGNVVLSGDDLRHALAADVFTGFDEVWVFAETHPAKAMIDLPCATSETADFGESIPQELTEAINQHRCLLVVGDGCGLNYATTSAKIVEAFGEIA